jgi:hypothetical protein
MTNSMIRALIPLLLSATLAACTTSADYPSLARRPAEAAVWDPAAPGDDGRVSGSAPVASAADDAAVSQAPVSAELTTRLAQLENAARAAHARFAAKRARAGQLVAAANGSAVASEAWSVATVAMAELESARSDAMVSLGELDRLYVAERIDGGDGSAIAAVRDQVTAWVADEDAVLADLGGRMAG